MTATAPAALTDDARMGRIGPEGEARCRQLLADWMAALNRHDAATLEACLRFPHVRLVANGLAVCDAQASCRCQGRCHW